MALGKKIFKSKHWSVHRFSSMGASRRNLKNFKKKLGLTSKNKWARQLKRSLSGMRGGALGSITPTNASDVGAYRYQGRSVSQLMGGV